MSPDLTAQEQSPELNSDEEEGWAMCTRCFGAGWIHACFDDLCRSGEPIDCKSARVCPECDGEGAMDDFS